MNYRTGWWLPDTFQRERKLFENEYLRREFKLLVYSGLEERARQLTLAFNSRAGIALTDNSIRNFKMLKGFPKRSILLVILSDETHRIRINILALINPAVKAIVKDYPQGSTENLRILPKLYIGKISRLKKFRELWHLFPKSVLSGAFVLFSQLVSKLTSAITGKEIIEIPQGYNAGFAKLYAKKFGLEYDQSIFEFAYKSRYESYQKSTNLVFLGQVGSLDRKLMLAEAQNMNIGTRSTVDLRINGNFIEGQKWSKQEEYFQLILNSQFTLCPPGNYSGSTFRFFESLVLHSYPIRDSFVFSDPLFDSRNLRVWPKIALSSGCFDLNLDQELQSEIATEIGIILEVIESARKRMSTSGLMESELWDNE